MALSMKINVAFFLVLLAAIANQSGQRCYLIWQEDFNKSLAYGTMALIACILSLICLDIIRLQPANSHGFNSMFDQYLYQKRHIFYGRYVWKSLNYYLGKPQSAQEKTFLQILHARKVAVHFGHRSIPSIEFYQSNVPFSDYADYEKQISELKGSSRTGDKQKASCLLEYISSKNVSNRMGRPLILLQDCYINSDESNLQQTDFLYSCFQYQSFWCYPKDVFNIQDEHTFLYLTAIYALKEREVSHIVANDSSMLFAFWRVVSQKWEDICDIIESGFIPEKLDIDRESYENIYDDFIGHRSRARKLRQEFRKGLDGIAVRIWPNCSYFQTLKLDLVAPELDLLQSRELSKIPLLRSCRYLDKEPIVIPETLKQGHYFVPNTQSFFFEWIKEDDVDSDWPNTLLSNQVQTGKSYEMVLTALDCRFLRCRTGFMVNFVTSNKERPAFSFTSSYDYFVNVAEEETRVDFLAEILRGSTKRLRGNLVNFAVTESVTDNFNIDSLRSYRVLYSSIGRVSYHYVLFIEVEKTNNKVQYEANELAQFEKDLCLTYAPYRRARKMKKLSPMKVIEVESGTFQKLRSIISVDKNLPPCNTPKILRTVKYLDFLIGQSKASFQWKKNEKRY